MTSQADDLGATPQRTDGILDAWAHGAISAASLLVNGRDAERAARLAVAAGLPLGLHLNLSEAAPLTAAPELRDPACQTQMRGKMGLRAAVAAGEVPPEAAVAEARAQVARFRELTGAPPAYFDGHQHCHVLPQLAPALAAAMGEMGVTATRIPDDLSARAAADTSPFVHEVMAHAVAARPVYAAAGVAATATHFVGLLACAAGDLSPEGVRSCLRAVPDPEAVELMVHPGLRTPEDPAYQLADAFGADEARERELAVLKELRLATPGAGALVPKHPERPVCVILGVTAAASGNGVTLRRLERQIQACGFRTAVFDCLRVSAEGVADVVARLGAAAVVGLHAWRAGRLVVGLPRSVRVALISGGTDGNVHAQDPERRAVMEAALARADAVVCFTRPLQEAFEAMGRPARLVPQAITVDELAPPGAAPDLRSSLPLLVLVAGLRPVKAPLFLLEAVRAWGGADVLLVGQPLDEATTAEVYAACGYSPSGSDPDPVEQARAVLRRQHFGYLPPLPRPQLLRLLADADAVVNSSESEGMSNAVLEAMALGKVMIARRNSGNAAVIEHGVTGLLFSTPEEFVALAQTLPLPAVEAAALEHVSRNHSAEVERAAYRSILLGGVGEAEEEVLVDNRPGWMPGQQVRQVAVREEDPLGLLVS